MGSNQYFHKLLHFFCNCDSFVLMKDRYPLQPLEHQRRAGNEIVVSRAVTDCFKFKVAIMVSCNELAGSYPEMQSVHSRLAGCTPNSWTHRHPPELSVQGGLGQVRQTESWIYIRLGHIWYHIPWYQIPAALKSLWCRAQQAASVTLWERSLNITAVLGWGCEDTEDCSGRSPDSKQEAPGTKIEWKKAKVAAEVNENSAWYLHQKYRSQCLSGWVFPSRIWALHKMLHSAKF